MPVVTPEEIIIIKNRYKPTSCSIFRKEVVLAKKTLFSIRKNKPQPETCSNEPRLQVDSTELLRSIELLSQSESIFPVHLKTQAIPLIKKLTLVLSDIDKQCQSARETLESETIRTSALRYKFVNMPNAIQTEILQVVMSARMSNKALIDDLQNKVITMEEEMERLKKDQEITDLHNSVLVPTMKNLQKQYDSAIDYLNNMLTMRAEVQISLNEARESLSGINEEISELETHIIQLQEDLKRDKEEHKVVKHNLSTQLSDTTQKRNTQRKYNAIGERDLYIVKDELRDSENELHGERRKLKRAKDNFTHCRSTLTMLDNESESNSMLIQSYTAKIPELRAKKASARKTMNEKREKYEADISTLSGEIDKIEDGNEQLRVTKKKLEKEVRALERANKSVSNELSVVRDVEKRSKQSLLKEADEATRLGQENRELEMRYENLQESHTAGVVAIRNKIVTSKELLEKRTEERQSVEIHLQDLQTKLQEKRQEEASFIATANQRMINAQEDQSNYVQESVVLEKEITEHSSLLSQLQNEFEKEKSEFNALEKLDSQDIALLRKSIDDVTVELALVQPECDELESKLNELMEELRDASEEYKLVQDKVIELKGQKSGLNERIQRITSETSALKCMQENLKIEILTKRANTKDIIRDYSKQAIELEQALWEVANKVRVVEMQNDHFKETINQLSADQSNMLDLISKRDEIRSLLLEEMDRYQSKLHIDWREDQKLERETSLRDGKMLLSMSQFSQIAIERKESLSSLCESMRDELNSLRTNLDSLCSNPPQDTRKLLT